MPRQPLTNFEIQKSYEMNLNFIVFIQERVYLKSRMYNKYINIYIYIYIINSNNITIMVIIYITNLDEYESIGFHWIALYINDDNVTYFDSFGVEHTPKKLRNSKEIKIL